MDAHAGHARPDHDALIAGLRDRREALAERYAAQLGTLATDRPIEGADREAGDRDIRRAADQLVDLLLDALSSGRDLTADDFAFARGYFSRALARGVDEQELVHSAQLWLRVVVDEVYEIAGPDGAAAAASLARQLIHYGDVGTRAAAGIAIELVPARQLTERTRRAELVTALLAGAPLDAAQSGLARACGLDPDGALAVVAARPAEPRPTSDELQRAAVALARAAQDAVEPLFCVRGGEIVVVRADRGDMPALIDQLERVHGELAAAGVALSVGISGRHRGLDRVPTAYDEAVLARDGAAPGGLLGISTLDPLGYLLLRSRDETAWSLVPDRIRAFLEQDRAEGGHLTATFSAYLAANGNARAAAEALSVHPNTVYYRLAKLEEAAGISLRDLSDVQQLTVALRLAP